MFYFVLFILELGLLFFLAKRLIKSLARLIYKFTKSHKVVVHTLAIIFLPGTIIHELAHLLFAGIMLVPVGEINVVPEILSKGQPSSGWEGEGVKLGSVQIGKTDPFRRVIVGVAPVLFGMLLIFSIFLLVKIGVSPWWQVALGLYLLFEIGNTMFSSRKDLEGSILFFVLVLSLIIIIALALHFLAPGIAQNIWVNISNMNFEIFINFFKQASIYLIVPVAIDLLVIFLVAIVCSKCYNLPHSYEQH